MTASYYCDVSAAPLPGREALKTLPADRLDRVTAALSRVKAKQIAYSWLLLRHAFRQAGWDAELLNHVKRSAAGKPILKDGIWFSLSHSDGTVGCTVSDEGPVGMDVQHQRQIPPQFYLPYFSPADQAWLTAHPEDFCPAWCRKEAILKCIGTGWTKEGKQGLDVIGCPVFDGKTSLFIRGQWLTEDCYGAVCCGQEDIPAPIMVDARTIGDCYA